MRIFLMYVVCILAIEGHSQVASSLVISDTRTVNSPPTFYNNEVKVDFKERSVIESPGDGTYSGLLTLAPWNNNAGGVHHQLSFNAGGVFWRTGFPDGSTWGTWSKLMTENVNVSINNVSVPFNWTVTDREYNRPLFKTGWTTTIGDFIAMKHGGNNNEANTLGLRISDINGFEVGTNDFSQPLLRMNMSGSLGLGTPSPNGKFKIHNTLVFNSNETATGQDHIILSANDPGNGGYFGGLTWESSGRRRASIVATREHSDPDYVGIAFFTKGTDGPGAMYESMRITRDGNVGIGITNPDAPLTVKGVIHTNEVRVDVNAPIAPDYVFEKDYNLLPLSEVEAYVNQNKHLPEVPSAKEMEEHGLNLKEMNLLLLKKVEELTLHLIEQDKKVETLQQSNDDLKKQNNEILLKLKKIESQ